MFQSYEYIKYLGLDPKTKQYRWEYRIVDDDWEEVAVGVSAGVGAVLVGASVINTYSKRGLPVASNLIRALQWHSQKYGFTLEQVIASQKQYNPEYAQYEDEINKYLI